MARSPITEVDGRTRTKECKIITKEGKIITKEDIFVTGGNLGVGKRERKLN